MSASTSRNSSARHTPTQSSRQSPVHSKSPIYKPVLGRCQLDDHLLTHQEASKDCYYCKKNWPTQQSSEENHPQASLPKNFQTYQSKVEHNGQHSDCPECQNLAIPTIKMFDAPLPRSGKEKKSELPYRNLGLGNYTPQFQNDLVSDLDFIKYRKADAEASQDIIRLQNYSNYQSVCLAQNLDDIGQDVIKTKTHLNGLHAEIDHIQDNQGAIMMKLDDIIAKMDILENAVNELKTSFKEEEDTASPVLIPDPSNDASFSFIGQSSSADEPMRLL